MSMTKEAPVVYSDVDPRLELIIDALKEVRTQFLAAVRRDSSILTDPTRALAEYNDARAGQGLGPDTIDAVRYYFDAVRTEKPEDSSEGTLFPFEGSVPMSELMIQWGATLEGAFYRHYSVPRNGRITAAELIALVIEQTGLEAPREGTALFAFVQAAADKIVGTYRYTPTNENGSEAPKNQVPVALGSSATASGVIIDNGVEARND